MTFSLRSLRPAIVSMRGATKRVLFPGAIRVASGGDEQRRVGPRIRMSRPEESSLHVVVFDQYTKVISRGGCLLAVASYPIRVDLKHHAAFDFIPDVPYLRHSFAFRIG